MSRTKETITYVHTVNGKTYTIDVPLSAVPSFEQARAEGSWIKMVTYATQIIDDTGQVLKARHIATINGRRYSVKSSREA